jgi:hypothetical protein
MTDYNSSDCPNCSHELAPIIYGFPAVETIELARQELVALGGTTKHAENRYCYGCHEIFYISSTSLDFKSA